jgi:glucose/arabinose dehydrogenase
MTGRRRAGAAGLAFGLAAALLGCGGDDASTGPSGFPAPTTVGPSAPGPTDPTAPSAPTSTSGPTEPTDPTDPSTPTSTGAPDTTVAPAPDPSAPPAVALTEVAKVAAPVAVVARPGDAAMFVVSQTGAIFVLDDEGLSGEPVLDVSSQISAGGEQGLLGLAFSPDGTKAYVHVTTPAGDGQIEAYPVGADRQFDASGRRVLLTVEHREFPNHNGGSVVTGPDGLLYLGFGDGGGGGDPLRAGQDPATALGKILRIDPRPGPDAPYTIPADNPFVGVDGVLPETWSYGLRNPWRFSFDRATGDLWVADVGQGDLEEVNHVLRSAGAGAAANFGWSAFEGTAPYNDDQTATNHTPPVHEYPHADGNASVTGGFVYRGSALPGLLGTYVFGDYASGRIWALYPNDEDAPTVVELAVTEALAGFGEGPEGELYVCSLAGVVYRLDPA